MINTIAILMLGTIPQTPPPYNVEMVQISHVYNKDSKEKRFVQIIIWDLRPGPFFQIREWFMAHKTVFIHKTNRKIYPYTIQYKRGNKTIEVRFRQKKVTHTYRDPEEDAREQLKVKERIPIGK